MKKERQPGKVDTFFRPAARPEMSHEVSKSKIFIDGAAGTTGLEIRERLGARLELELLTLSDVQRKLTPPPARGC